LTRKAKYSLKSGKKAKATYVSTGYGPTFGWGHDLNTNLDSRSGYTNLGYTYNYKGITSSTEESKIQLANS